MKYSLRTIFLFSIGLQFIDDISCSSTTKPGLNPFLTWNVTGLFKTFEEIESRGSNTPSEKNSVVSGTGYSADESNVASSSSDEKFKNEFRGPHWTNVARVKPKRSHRSKQPFAVSPVLPEIKEGKEPSNQMEIDATIIKPRGKKFLPKEVGNSRNNDWEINQNFIYHDLSSMDISDSNNEKDPKIENHKALIPRPPRKGRRRSKSRSKAQNQPKTSLM